MIWIWIRFGWRLFKPMCVLFLQLKYFGDTFQLSEGLHVVLYMAEYNFLRGYNVHYERTLSLVTYGYQEVAAYIESVLLQANELSSSDDGMRTVLYVSAAKEIHRVEVTIEVYDIFKLVYRYNNCNWPNSQIPKCTCSISHNAPFRTEMCTFLFWKEHCGIWNRYILGFVKLVYCSY